VVDRDAGIALGHRRLAIVDLRMRPATDDLAGGRFVITFNGEIYKFVVAAELERCGQAFIGSGDAESCWP
jgi:asparagine synthase (glutamine-hydrolysing)